MAGGSGTRFWPKSTQKLPKQFLQLFGTGTMLQNTVRRIENRIPIEQIYVVTNSHYVSLVKEQLPNLPAENVIGEPEAKNTAPCVAISAAILDEKDEDAIMVVLPADHHITKPDKFINILNSAITKAAEGEHLVTIGITPDRPETGYGYIEAERTGAEENPGEAIPVKAFREKPDLKKAQEFLEKGGYYWNSGMFIWSAKAILDSFFNHLPEMYAAAVGAAQKGDTPAINNFYYNAQSVSIDYGIMEHANNVYVVPGEFGWNDVGSWLAVYELADKDDNGNFSDVEATIFVEASNNLISSGGEKAVAVVGLDHIAVVETEDAILVCNLDQAQGVKQIVEYLKEKKDLQNYL